MIKKLLLCFFLSIFLLFLQKARAQYPDASADIYCRFFSFSTNQGLSNAFATDILQDKSGFIWVATINGLNRLDGGEVVQYFHYQDDPNSLSDNVVTALAEDNQGNLWIGTKNGLCSYDRSKNTFTRYSTSPDSKYLLSDNYIRALYADKSGNLWIETLNGGLNFINILSGKVGYYPHANPAFEGDYYYHFIFEDSKERIWIGTRNFSPQILNKKTGELRVVQGSDGNDGCCIFEDDNHVLWASGNYGIFRYNESSHQFVASADFKIPFRVQAAINDEDGNLWFGGAGDRILRFDQKHRRWTAFMHTESNPYSPVSTEINKIYKDRQGNIWFATANGVSVIPKELNKFRHYRNIPGLNSLHSNKVTALAQDRKGILWIGTEDHGLDTFSLSNEQFGNLKYHLFTRDIDKNTFEKEKDVLKQYARLSFIKTGSSESINHAFDSYENYRNANLTFSANSEDKVSTLYVDRQGSVWIGYWSDIGFNRFSYSAGFKRNSLFTKGLVPIFSNELWCSNFYSDFLEDHKNNFWMATWEGIGLNLYNRTTSEFEGKYYYSKGKSLDGRIYSLTRQNDSLLWLAPAQTLIACLNTNTNRLQAYVSDDLPADRLDEMKYMPYSGLLIAGIPAYEGVASYITDKEGCTWVILYSRAILKYSAKTNRFDTFQLGNIPGDQFVATAYSSEENSIYLGTARGDLYVFECNSHRLKRVGTVPGAKSGSGKAIEAICSFGNNIWIGLSKGIVQYERKTNRMRYYGELPGIRNPGLTKVSCFAPAGNDLYFNSGSRILAYSTTDKKFREITLKLDPDKEMEQTTALCYHSGTLWIGTINGLIRLDLHSGKHTLYRHDNTKSGSLPDNEVLDLEIVSHEVFVSTMKGLCKVDVQSGKMTLLNQIPSDRLSSRLLTRLFEDKDGFLWIGTSEMGVNRLDPRSSTIDHFFEAGYDNTSLLGNNVESIFQDSKGNLWIGTDKGLNRFNAAAKNFIRYASFRKLNPGAIKAIEEDMNGNLWISTTNGMILFTALRQEVIRITYLNGLQANSFSNASAKLEDGRLAFGGQNGLTVFDPLSVDYRGGFPQVIIKNVRIGDSLWFADFSDGKLLHLKYFQNNIVMQISSSEICSPSLIQYRYRLKGFEDAWSYTGSADRLLKYNNLKPGRYLLEINATNVYGVWNPKSVAISIVIKNPWWVAWWFRVLSFLVIIASIYGIIRIREASLKEARNKLEKTVAQRTGELAETNQRLRQSEQLLAETLSAKDKFFSIVAHDLKNPVIALRNISDRLVTEFQKLTVTQQSELLASMNKQIHLTYSFLDNLLLWALSQKNAIPYNPQVYNLDQLIQEVTSLLGENARLKEITVSMDTGGSCQVSADRNMLLTVINNLLSNAIKFSYPGGKIYINSKNEEGWCTVSIRDEGTGIPKNRLDNLFSISSRYRAEGTAQESGTGTGLLLSREFIEKHGGKIWAQSVEGKGSTFSFTLQEYKCDKYNSEYHGF